MKLYFSPGACSLASHIALLEAGISFELIKVEGRGQKTAGGEDYSNITAKGYVPALKLNSGEVLTEGTAILPYIADLAPEKHLAPAAGTLDRYRLHEWLGYINSEVHKNFSPFFTPGATDEQKAAARAQLERRVKFIEEHLADKPFLLGEHFSVTDCYLFTVLSWCAYVKIDVVAVWPGLKSYMDRIAVRPAVQAALKAEGLIK
ncbi:MAG: glutathione transferase GstA [Steroidobacteraceae bacterium]